MTSLTHRQRLSVATVLSAMALAVVDGGTVQVGLASIASSLDASPSGVVSVASAYQLAVLMALLPCAHLAERIGARRVFMAGVATFGLAALASAIAPTLPILVMARFLQGLGGAAMLALGIALLRAALGTERLGQAITWNALTVALSAAFAPVIGGFVLSIASWPALFLIDVPLAAASLLAALSLPKVQGTHGTIASAAMLLLAATAAAGIFAVGFTLTRPAIAALLLATALASAALLYRRDRRSFNPIVPWDLLAQFQFRRSVMASVFSFTGVSAALIAIPLHLQMKGGLSPSSTGWLMASWPLAAAVTSQLAQRLSQRWTSAQLCTAGAVIMGLGMIIASFASADLQVRAMLLAAMLCGSGFGLFQVANNRTMFFAAPGERSAAAGGMQGTARLTGQTMGAVLVSALLAAASPAQNLPFVLIVAAMFSAAAAVLSGLRPPCPSIAT